MPGARGLRSFVLAIQSTFHVYASMGVRRNFSRGANHRHLKKFQHAVQKSPIFWRAEGANKISFFFSQRFRLKYGVSIANAVGVSENFWVFCRTTTYGGGGQVSPLAPPLRTPMYTSTELLRDRFADHVKIYKLNFGPRAFGKPWRLC